MANTLYIAPTASGDGSGSSWENAATLDQISTLIALAGPGGQVLLRADQGIYQTNGAIVVSEGGTAGAAVTIMGVDGGGNPMKAVIAGTRADPWTAGAASGTEVFKLLSGADNLNFQTLEFRNVGDGAIRVGAPISNLTISDIYATNVQRLVENLASAGQSDASITGLYIHDVVVDGYSRGAIRLQYNTSDVVIRDVIGDSQQQDGDNFAIGVALGGGAHDVLLQRVEMANARDTVDPSYWNGDGFTSERGNYNITFDTVVAIGNTDGGLDLKSQATTVSNAIAIGNAHNLRLWDYSVTLTNILAGSTDLHGGPANPYNLSLERGANDVVTNSFFYEPSATTPIFNLGSGDQTLTLRDVYTVGAYYAQLIGGSVLKTLPASGNVNFVMGTSAGDAILGTGGRDILYGDEGGDQLYGGGGDDQLIGSGGDDVLDGGTGADLMTGGLGNDIYMIDSINDLVGEEENEGVDLVLTTLGRYRLRVNFENLTFTGDGAFVGDGNRLDNLITGGSGDDALSGYAGNDTLDGGLGADRLAGGLGDDLYVVDAAGDVVVEAAGEGRDTVQAAIDSYALTANVENLTYTGVGDFIGTGNALGNRIVGGRGNDMLAGGDGDDVLDGGAGGNLLIGGTGNDLFIVASATDTIVENAGEGIDGVATTLNTLTLAANVERLTFTGTGDFAGTGNGENNAIVAGAGRDMLIGLAGNDVLDGGAGDDVMVGGTGDDAYAVDSVGDVVTELAGEGNDTVRTTLQGYALGAEIENLVFTGTGSFTGTGNALDNVLTGGSGDDRLDGGAGADTMIGGAGNDVYAVDTAADVVVEAADGGIDTIVTTLTSYTLGAEIENLTYSGPGPFAGTGNARNNAITGSAASDVLAGADGDDLLDGGAGADMMIGGIGNDVFVVDAAGDLVVEREGEGIDTVRTTLNAYALADTLEDLTFTGTGNFIGTGTSLDNAIVGGAGNDVLTGLAGNDTLDGGAGDDVMDGGVGDDVYVVDAVNDQVIEQAGGGYDTVRTTLSGYALGEQVESLVYVGTGNFTGTGNRFDNNLVGGAGNDLLDGGLGDDRMAGGAGNDGYVVDSTGDIVVEAAGAGIDTVRTSLASYALGENVENLAFTGTGNFVGQGQGLDNAITGGAGSDVLNGAGGNDVLDGGAGADVMIGGTGDDDYIVDAAADAIVENDGEGYDRVRTTAAAYTLSANIEMLGFVGAGDFAGTGNAQDNVLVGGGGHDTLNGMAGNDLLDGGAGDDVMVGGTGDDGYIVDSAGDVVTEQAGEGIDLVRTSSSTYTLGANVENLTATGTAAFAGTGNVLDNIVTGGVGNDTLTGLAGNDVLIGGAGADRMVGGIGNDTYYVDATGDSVVEAANEGTDLVYTSLASYTLGANLENLSYTGTAAFTGTGNALANVITGGAGSDVLAGLGGADTLIGGDGVDTATYTASAAAVVVSLVTGQGSGGDAAGDVLTGIENLTGSAYADTLTGNDAANTINGGKGADILYGMAGNDSINGQAGADIAYGGTGNDTYTVDETGDQVIEYADEGYDTVQSSLLAYTLGANLEKLTYSGSGNFTGIGNALDNVLVGNSGADTLRGGTGNDNLDGGTGNDMLDGGADNDTIEGRAGADTLIGGDGNDTATYVFSAIGVTVSLLTGTGRFGDAEGDTLSQIENLTGSKYADTLTGDAGVNILTGGAGNDTLNGAGGLDTLIGGVGDDTYQIDAVGVIVTELVSQGTDQVNTSLNSYVLDANIEGLTFTGTGNFVAIGNALANVIRGGAGNDYIDGGLNGDAMIGGAGDDTYVIDSQQDVVSEQANEGLDTVLTTRQAYILGVNVENLTYIGNYPSGYSFTGTGNALNNVIIGGIGTDFLDGRGGDDTLVGGLGSDTYTVDSVGDVIVEYADEGIDTVKTSLLNYTLAASLERLTYTGSSAFAGYGNEADNIIISGKGADTLYGYGGNDTLIGGAGADTMYGGAGDDIYRVDSTGDVVVEAAGEGADLVLATLASYTLGANVENLTYAGTADFGGTGNMLDNMIVGGRGNDLLDGGLGNDMLTGGRGDDTYVVEAAGDVVVEAAGEGYDTVRTTLSAYALAAEVEALIFTGTGSFAGTGNALANAITGGGGNDVLDGGLGADVLTGGIGNDTYVVDDAGDGIVEAAGEGYDTVRTVLSAYTLGAELEALAFVGSGSFAGTGNALANAIAGGTGNDVLDGGLGADTLTGGLGDDVYVVDDAGDVIVEAAGEGGDSVRTALLAYTLGANIETLAFTGTGNFAGTGNALANMIVGGAGNDMLDGGGGNDVLDGGLGADVLTGGIGDDLYVVDNGGDRVVEAAGGGSDTVTTSLANYTLGLNVEALIFTATGAFSGTGNALDNQITGGVGNDTLLGLAGTDLLFGGGGDDMLNGGVGLDTLRGGIGNDTLIGETHSDQLYGEDGNDMIVGDAATMNGSTAAANDQAWGGEGNDTIYGDGMSLSAGVAGKDILYGGGGDDLIFGDADTITGGTLGNDTLYGDAGNDILYGDGRATSAGIAGGSDRLNGGMGDDRLFGGGGNDVFVFDARGFGQDVIGDFGQKAGDRDVIDLSGQKLKFADLHISYVGGNAIVETPAHDTITLLGVASLTQADFLI